MAPESIGSPALWAGFSALVVLVLALDLGVFHRTAHRVGLREALVWSLVWIGLALAFNAVLWRVHGPTVGLEFLAGYLIEKALSVDNIFVFLLLFTHFGVPPAYQHRVLFWGILGAIVMRAGFIAAGAALLGAFHWIIYVFGGVLVLTGVKMLRRREALMDPERSAVLRLFRKVAPSVPEYHGQRFTILRGGRRYATPLLAVLVLVEATDLIFAVDSIPAVFAVTRDPFIVYTSNVFAILGLRALYFLLAGVMERFRHLKTGLALVLVFVGLKMAASDLYRVPIGVSLGVIAVLLAGAVAASLVGTRGAGAPGSGGAAGPGRAAASPEA